MKRFETISKLHCIFRNLANRLDLHLTRNNIANLLRDGSNKCLEHQRTDLGVSVIGFIAIDMMSRKILHLFGSEERNKSFSLPYAWNKHVSVEYENWLTHVFETWRSQESLGEENKIFPSNVYPPEYLFYPNKNISYNIDKKLQDKELIANQWGMHYVPAGEILFFLIVWRMLLRINATNVNIIEYLTNLNNGVDSFLNYKFSIWESIPFLSHREQSFLSSFDKPKTSKIRDTWKEISANFDTYQSEPYAILTDLERLSLISQINNRNNEWVLNPEFWYLIEYICKLIEPHGYISFVYDFKEKLEAANTIKLETVIDLVNILLNCFSLLVRGKSCAESSELINEPLKLLHLYARFPIMPYYYWIIFDGEVKSHLVIPTSESQRRRGYIHTAPSRTSNSFESAYKDIPKTLSGVSSVAVIGVKPLFCFDSTINIKKYDSDFSQEEFNRIFCIRDFVTLISHSIIDEALYGSILFDSYQKQVLTYYDRVAHEEKNRLIASEGRIIGALEILTKHSLEFPKSQEVINELNHAMKSVKNSRKNIEDLLRRIKSGRNADYLPVSFDIIKFLPSIIINYQNTDIDISIVSDTKPAIVFAAKEEVTTIFGELLKNSVAAFENSDKRSKIKISVEAFLPEKIKEKIPTSIETEVFLITFEDDGPGIDEKIKESIFSYDFYSGGTGTGHGLPLIKDILKFPFIHIADLKGREVLRSFTSPIWFDTNIKGTIFTFILPKDPLNEHLIERV